MGKSFYEQIYLMQKIHAIKTRYRHNLAVVTCVNKEEYRSFKNMDN